MLVRAPDIRAENPAGYPEKPATATLAVPDNFLWGLDGDGLFRFAGGTMVGNIVTREDAEAMVTAGIARTI